MTPQKIQSMFLDWKIIIISFSQPYKRYTGNTNNWSPSFVIIVYTSYIWYIPHVWSWWWCCVYIRIWQSSVKSDRIIPPQYNARCLLSGARCGPFLGCFWSKTERQIIRFRLAKKKKWCETRHTIGNHFFFALSLIKRR